MFARPDQRTVINFWWAQASPRLLPGRTRPTRSVLTRRRRPTHPGYLPSPEFGKGQWIIVAGTSTQTDLLQRATMGWRRTTTVQRRFLIRFPYSLFFPMHSFLLQSFLVFTLPLQTLFSIFIPGTPLLVVHRLLWAEQQSWGGLPRQQPLGHHRRVHEPKQQEQQPVLPGSVVKCEPQLDYREHEAPHWKGCSPVLCGRRGLCRVPQWFCYIRAGIQVI